MARSRIPCRCNSWGGTTNWGSTTGKTMTQLFLVGWDTTASRPPPKLTRNFCQHSRFASETKRNLRAKKKKTKIKTRIHFRSKMSTCTQKKMPSLTSHSTNAQQDQDGAVPLPPHALGHQGGEPPVAAPEPLGPAHVLALGAFGPKRKADQDTGHGRQKESVQNSYFFIRFLEVVDPCRTITFFIKKLCMQFGRTKPKDFWCFEGGLMTLISCRYVESILSKILFTE